jgi:putative ABC transport system ATP-binding protein
MSRPGNLDPETAARVLDILSEKVRAGRTAAVLVTHSEIAARAADRIFVLGPGGLVERDVG